MNIISILFIFIFLPLSIGLYHLTRFLEDHIPFFKTIRLSDLFTIGISIVFYAYLLYTHAIYLLIYILFFYFLSLLIRKIKHKKILLTTGIIICLSILFNYKYFPIFRNTTNNLMVPLGLSFITFSTISFLVDTYKDKRIPLNIIDTFLYILFFPKVVSGPIIKFKDFSKQIYNKTFTSSKIIEGINLIIIGLAKKIIIADTFGQTISNIKEYMYSGIDIPTGIGLIILYSFQLYYDFSGYSDIAIGLSKLFGFNFEKNFDYPYTSISFTEFWRRWHISLGDWFREYIYIPLGGNRKGKYRTILNIFIVFVLTGIWHGAGITYLSWGILHGIFRIIEGLIKDKKIYKNTPKIIKYIFTILLVMILWTIFMFNDFKDIKFLFNIIFGIKKFARIPFTYKYYFSRKIMIILAIAIYGATIKRYINYNANTKTKYILKEIAYMFLLIISILFLVNSTYSPFIYFQY